MLSWQRVGQAVESVRRNHEGDAGRQTLQLFATCIMMGTSNWTVQRGIQIRPQVGLVSPASARKGCRKLSICAAHKITVLPGDGIGPEIAKVAVNVLKAAGEACGEEFTFQEELIGGAAM